jgi:uncharacterized MAPEG superfamily protein
MQHLLSEPWTAVALLAIVTHLKLFTLAAIQGVTRVRHRRFVKPEDAAYFGRGATPASEEHPRVTLAQRAIDNEIENLPTFALALVAFAALRGPGSFALAVSCTFLIARAAHSVFYVRPTQPHRNRVYILGQLATFALLVRLALHVVGE